MSYTYLMDTYVFIQKRLDEVQRQMLAAGDDDWKARQHAAGQVDALCAFERFLSENFDAKLPKRLLRRLSNVARSCSHLRSTP